MKRTSGPFWEVVVKAGEKLESILLKYGFNEAQIQSIVRSVDKEALSDTRVFQGLGLNGANEFAALSEPELVNSAGQQVVRVQIGALDELARLANASSPDPVDEPQSSTAVADASSSPIVAARSPYRPPSEPVLRTDTAYNDFFDENFTEAAQEMGAKVASMDPSSEPNRNAGVSATASIYETRPVYEPPKSNPYDAYGDQNGDGAITSADKRAVEWYADQNTPTGGEGLGGDPVLPTTSLDQISQSEVGGGIKNHYTSQGDLNFNGVFDAGDTQVYRDQNTPDGGESIGNTGMPVTIPDGLPVEVQRYLNDQNLTTDTMHTFTQGKSLEEWWDTMSPEGKEYLQSSLEAIQTAANTPEGGESIGNTGYSTANTSTEVPADVQRLVYGGADRYEGPSTQANDEWWNNMTPTDQQALSTVATQISIQNNTPEGGESLNSDQYAQTNPAPVSTAIDDTAAADAAAQQTTNQADWDNNGSVITADPVTVTDLSSVQQLSANDTTDNSSDEQTNWSEAATGAETAGQAAVEAVQDDSQWNSDPEPDGQSYGSADSAEAWTEPEPTMQQATSNEHVEVTDNAWDMANQAIQQAAQAAAQDQAQNEAATQEIYESFNEVTPTYSVPEPPPPPPAPEPTTMPVDDYAGQVEQQKINAMLSAQATGARSAPLANPDGTYSGYYITNDGNLFTPTDDNGDGVLDQDQAYYDEQAAKTQTYYSGPESESNSTTDTYTFDTTRPPDPVDGAASLAAL